MRPMLAADFHGASLRWPYLGSPKLDGIRCIVKDGTAFTRSLKQVRNQYIQRYIAKYQDLLQHADGELVVGPSNDHGVYNVTNSGVMSADGEPDFHFYVFDMVDDTGKTFLHRQQIMSNRLAALAAPRISWLPQQYLPSQDELMAYEERIVDLGYEGVMLRSPTSLYKLGRATPKEATLLKLKRFLDAEAEIIGF